MDAGVVEPIAVNGGLNDHARLVVEKIQELTGAGVASDQIAVLYPRRGFLLDLLTQAFTDSGIGFVHERDQRLPTGPLVEFLRRCASRRLAGPQPCGHGLVTDVRAAAPIISELTSEFLHLSVGKRAGRPRIETGELLQGVLDSESERGESLQEERLTWLIERLDSTLELRVLAANAQELRDRAAIRALDQLDEVGGITLEQFAAQDLSLGKVVLTTYHSAKGREFSVVILPGLVEGIVPYLAWSKRLGKHEEPARAILAEQRRTFYVAFTRAADAAVLICGPGFETEWGAWNDLGPSRFVVDVVEHLDHGK
jgi:DNA helicase-2/ATP-dependent DNA helicase PcrA